MGWPSSHASITNLDSGTDSKKLARPDLKDALDKLNLIIDCRGAALGIVPTNASNQIDFSYMPTGTTASTVAVGNHNHDTLYQPLDATLTALSGLTTGADKVPYFTGTDTANSFTITSFMRSLANSAGAADVRSTLSLIPGTNVQTYSAELAAIAGLSTTGYLKRTGAGTWALDAAPPAPTLTFTGDATGTGTTSIALTLATVAISKGGTGQTTATAGFNALSPLTTLGDMLFHNGTNNARLAGSISATRKFLSQTGTGTVSAAPSWIALASTDIPSLDWSKITTGKPTTLAGYGITDAAGLDSDLTAIAALPNSTGYLKKISDGVWALDGSTFLMQGSDVQVSKVIVANGTLPKDKVHLHGTVDDVNAYAIGIETGSMYYRSGGKYRWYVGTAADGGTSDVMELTSTSLTLGVGINLGVNSVTSDLPVLGTIGAKRFVDTVTSTTGVTGSKTINLSLGRVFKWVLDGNTTVSAVSNVPSDSTQETVWWLYVTQDSDTAKTLTWSLAGLKWPGGTTPTMTATLNKTDIYEIRSPDGGTTWYGRVVGQNY